MLEALAPLAAQALKAQEPGKPAVRNLLASPLLSLLSVFCRPGAAPGPSIRNLELKICPFAQAEAPQVAVKPPQVSTG